MPLLAVILGDFVGVSYYYLVKNMSRKFAGFNFDACVCDHTTRRIGHSKNKYNSTIYYRTAFSNYEFFFQVLSNLDPQEVLKEVRRFCLIFVGIGVFSGLTNFIMVMYI